jgi:hypothetical protein
MYSRLDLNIRIRIKSLDNWDLLFIFQKCMTIYVLIYLMLMRLIEYDDISNTYPLARLVMYHVKRLPMRSRGGPSWANKQTHRQQPWRPANACTKPENVY